MAVKFDLPAMGEGDVFPIRGGSSSVSMSHVSYMRGAEIRNLPNQTAQSYPLTCPKIVHSHICLLCLSYSVET